MTAHDRITFWPEVGPTESLYSICSALQHLRGGVSARKHSLYLFDDEGAAWLRQVPVNLNHYCHVTHGLLGTPQEILLDRTAVGLHLRFMDPKTANNFVLRACTPRAPGFKFQTPETKRLRLCIECVMEDRQTLGRTTWRLEHQLPGVKICTTHRQWLQEIPESNRQGSKAWLRADMFVSKEPCIPIPLKCDAELEWCNLADILWVLKSHHRVFPPLLHQVLAAHLTEIRVLKAGRFLNSKIAASWLKRHWLPFFDAGFEALQGDWLSFLDGRGAHHPLKWAALFASCISAARLNQKLGCAYQHQATLDGKWVVAAVSNEDLLPQEVWDALISGAEVPNVAAETNRTTSSINRALRLNPELKVLRDANVRQNILMPRRQWVLDFLRKHPGAKRRQLLQNDSASLRWLDLNDREWLWTHVPPTKSGRWPQRALFAEQ